MSSPNKNLLDEAHAQINHQDGIGDATQTEMQTEPRVYGDAGGYYYYLFSSFRLIATTVVSSFRCPC